ncbi:MAG TPA: response regulator transcription factor [Bryobacteraceae bacterium]|nr:response regulator transcription factor [Bryobacteraceae bacterium]
MGGSGIRVLIADDHPLIRSGLRALLDHEEGLEVVAEAEDGLQAIELAAAYEPDVILLDVGMPRMNGSDAALAISQKLPRARIIMVSMHSDEGYVLRALKAGARGYLLKASPETDIIAAIRAVAAGNSWFSPAVTKILVEDYVGEVRRRGKEDSYDLLSLREKEILNLLVTGRSNRDIADTLHLSVSTVETHRSNIFQKVQVRSLPELILYAVRKGLAPGAAAL